ncbi:Crp/Fnr family transcriptional regulator [Hymenobacter sp. H14-R3]|uniref:Crp/Fnr family transcriptional regulator n=1 Tax=Hymenobacter sp. H14-R3 TaxID=3046308 RepID=UPI0024B8E186|nr:Crp/Fnr family transcriptional regulator [Hymenobacter sp. H14-R3]MDJ0367709.1 Crp/Fnr family transcriptional regulator [Hymenobacter sp. H14-R3]
MIEVEILEQFGATQKSLDKGETLFAEGEPAHFYHQVLHGEVRMVNHIEDGTEFIQGIFRAGQSLGEPPLFGQFPYPASAVASQPAVVSRLAYPALVELLHQYFDIHQRFLATLAKRLQYKSMQAREMSSYPADHQLLTLLSYFKRQAGDPPAYLVPLTRQELADLTGLRVETVIRTVKQLEQAGKLALHEGKIVL